MYVPNAGHGGASGVLYVCLVNIGPGIQERHTDIYGHVCMGVFSDIGASLMPAGDQMRRQSKDGPSDSSPTTRPVTWCSTGWRTASHASRMQMRVERIKGGCLPPQTDRGIMMARRAEQRSAEAEAGGDRSSSSLHCAECVAIALASASLSLFHVAGMMSELRESAVSI